MTDVIEKLKSYFDSKAQKQKEETMVKTNTKMTLAHFHDFYYLQALQAEIISEISRSPEIAFRRSVEKLQMDVQIAIEEISANMAQRVFVYLFAACLGESRHARTEIARSRYVRQARKSSRHELFASAVKYAPTLENINTLVSVFSQDWGSGYGGKAWKGIAEALRDYYTTPATAWLDHVVDLEHNNGTAFNKSDAGNTIYFDTDYEYSFSNFLDYKFAKNILAQPIKDRYNDSIVLGITRLVHSLVTRYSNIFDKKAPWWLRANLSTLDDYIVEWGAEKLEAEEKWCEWVNVSDGNLPSAEKVLSLARVHDIYPPSFTEPQLKAKMAKVKKLAKMKCGKFLDKKLAKRIDEKSKKHLESYLQTCKVQKAKTTYAVLPFEWAKLANNVLHVFIPLPYQKGYGTEIDGGFIYEIPFTKIAALPWNFSTLGGLESGHIGVKYSQITIETETQQLAVYDKKLEALID